MIFGQSVAVSGQMVVVTSLGGEDTPGCAYYFECDTTGCLEISKLVPDDHLFNDFGWRVLIEDDFIFMSVPLDDDANKNAGAIYVSPTTRILTPNMLLTQEIILSTSSSGDAFGYSVDVSGSMIVIGAHGYIYI
mmetsp:Transcript_12684/g.17053  ORF Transcript_12684/g.17053 Transcript_12684/m.17053 type:complete len:134 (-) Transcript_12684:456-857(-)